jgi:hypothetical protein
MDGFLKTLNVIKMGLLKIILKNAGILKKKH